MVSAMRRLLIDGYSPRAAVSFAHDVQVAGPQRLEAADHRDHRVVAAAAHDLVVELAADLGELAPSSMCSAIESLISLELRDEVVRAVRPLRGQRCAHRVEFLQRGAEVGERHGVALQQQAEHVGRTGLGGRVHHGAAAVAAPDRHQALGLEDSQGFPQRHQADVELLDEDFLPRQQVAVGQFAVDDLTA